MKDTIVVTKKNLENYSEDVDSLWLVHSRNDNNVAVLDSPPDAFTFLRDFVSMSRPCIIRNAIPQPQQRRHQQQQQQQQQSSPKIRKDQQLHRNESNNSLQQSENWKKGETLSVPLTLSLDDLVDVCHPRQESINFDGNDEEGEKMILTVDVTPDGHGDCIRTVIHTTDEDGVDNDTAKKKELKTKMFVRPEEREMSLLQFRELLRSSSLVQTSPMENSNASTSGNGNYNELNYCRASSSKFRGDNDGDCAEIVDDYEKPSKDKRTENNAVFYYSRQNDCLRTELKQIFNLNLFPSTFQFAEEAFGTGAPDAINLWIGNETSVSSMHKDHYENLFYVLSGEKIFTVCPPADAPFLQECEFEGGAFRQSVGGGGGVDANNQGTPSHWVVDCDTPNDGCDDTDGNPPLKSPQSNRVRWIEPDIERILPPLRNSSTRHQTNASHERKGSAQSAYIQKYPKLAYAHPMRIHVREGDMLYLPALWYHRVTQTCETVGINYWYDMRFDSPHWCYFNFLQHLGGIDPSNDG